MKPKIVSVDSYPVSVFIAGDYKQATICAKMYCDTVGYCVTVTPTKYVYTGGEEDGVIVGLINYPRFPSTKENIIRHAESLAHTLCDALQQKSYSIQTPEKTTWYSYREEDITND